MSVSQTSQPTLTFERLTLNDWRQFEHIDLTFHHRLTVLTGANAAGKTTVLNLLASHFGWQAQFVGTPLPRRRGGPLAFFSGRWRRRQEPNPQNVLTLGHLHYTNGTNAALEVPEEFGSAAFTVNLANQQPVQGLFIPSHRPTFAYQQVSQIPTTPPSREQMLSQYLGEFRSRYYGGGGVSSSYRLKEALIALAVFGEGNTVVQPNPEALAIYQGFVQTLREVMPPAIGFRDLSIRMPEIVMLTDSGDFSFDAVSGGVAAIIDLAFQIYMRSYEDDHFVVIIDEPENHLHPELQRSLLPGFLDAFPGIQFIVATHNPFMVGSVPDSNVYVLRHDSVDMSDAPIQEGIPRRRVVSTFLENVDKAGTSDDILRDVLGVPATKALWVERSMQEILARYEQEPLTEDLLRSLHQEFERLGLADVFPQNAKRILDRDQTN